MVYTISRNADPIGANTNLYWGNSSNKNVLANCATTQPYQSAFTTLNIPSIFTNTGRKNMGFSFGCVPAPNTHFMPTGVMGNGTLFTMSGSAFGGITGNTLMGGNFGRVCPNSNIFNQGFTTNVGNMFGGFNPFGGFNSFGGFNPFGFNMFGGCSSCGGGNMFGYW